jgi:GTP diphosphokinase / guanosine-3',5'-bis(diphosphate) 3'-diphosphatase
MEKITIDQLIKHVREYNACEEQNILKAYHYAELKHSGQKRQSGEDYILHPLSVAYILSEMHADKDTICAALLHDVIEDSDTTKDDIAKEFSIDIANLVDGVTKISKMNFSTKGEQTVANTRKILSSITEDVRIIIIKLADRLHNMRTLEHKSEFKQKENALETMEIYVPLAYYIGAYRLKSELEDLSLKYLKPETYLDIKNRLQRIEKESDQTLKHMLNQISTILNEENISHEIKVRTKNIYGVYKKLSQNHKLLDIHDLLALKIMVDDVKQCYHTLGIIHSQYPPINNKFKDYIAMPKTNMYQSLHTTVFGPDDKLVQTQIRTFEMDKIASFGLTAYWDANKGLARSAMQDDLNKKFQFFKSLREINSMNTDNQEFLLEIKNELFSNNVYVYSTKGDIIQLPIGSTPIDFAYRIHTEIGNTMVAAIVNDNYVSLDYKLKNKDRIKIVTDILSYGPKNEWIEIANTSYAKRKIKEFNNKIAK